MERPTLPIAEPQIGSLPRDGAGESLEAVRTAALHLAADPLWLPALSRELADAIHSEMPELAEDEDLQRATLASCESVVRLFLEIVRCEGDLAAAEPPPAAIEYAREFVRRGVSIETLLRAYHVAHAAFFDRWVRQLHDSITDPAELSEAIEAGATAAFTFVNALVRGLVRRYAEERELWVRSAAAVRVEEVRAVLAGEAGDISVAGARLGYDLASQHLGFVVWSDADAGVAEADLAVLERFAATLKAGKGGSLLIPLGSRTIAGWTAAPGVRGEHDHNRVPDGVRVAFGSPGSGVEGFRRTHAEAMRARRVARRSGSRHGATTEFGDVALASLASADIEQAQEFVETQLGPLAATDDHTRRLAATLRIYLEEHASPRRTARRLGVHENTIANRIRTVRELLGGSIDGRVAELLVALRLAPILADTGSEQGQP